MRKSDSDKLDGRSRAAILLMALGEEPASAIIKHLTPKEVQQLGVAITNVKNVSRQEVNATLEEFLSHVIEQTPLGIGTEDYLKNALEMTVGKDKAQSLISRILSGQKLVSGIEKAWRGFREGGQLRGASTISQQVAKNLFLWPEKSLVRKGLEAWLTLAVELTWPKRRILEVYLNIAQFSANTYGIGAASWRYFDRPAVALTGREATLLAAVLPNPERLRIDVPSRFVRKRAHWVSLQMRQLGEDYLRGL